MLSKIIKFVATRCHILQPKRTKFDFTALPQTLYLDFRRPTSKGREGVKEGRKEGRDGRKEKQRREKRGNLHPIMLQNLGGIEQKPLGQLDALFL